MSHDMLIHVISLRQQENFQQIKVLGIQFRLDALNTNKAEGHYSCNQVPSTKL